MWVLFAAMFALLATSAVPLNVAGAVILPPPLRPQVWQIRRPESVIEMHAPVPLVSVQFMLAPSSSSVCG